MKKYIILLSLLTIVFVKFLAQTKVENLKPGQKEIYKTFELILRIQHEDAKVLNNDVETGSNGLLKALYYKTLPLQPMEEQINNPGKKVTYYLER